MGRQPRQDRLCEFIWKIIRKIIWKIFWKTLDNKKQSSYDKIVEDEKAPRIWCIQLVPVKCNKNLNGANQND